MTGPHPPRTADGREQAGRMVAREVGEVSAA